MQILLSLSIALLAGLLLSRLAKVMKLPAVTAYLVAGILVGPFLLGRVSLFGVHLGFVEEDLSAFKIISEVAKTMGGGGGGKPESAQAGGKDPSKAEEALSKVAGLVEGQLK